MPARCDVLVYPNMTQESGNSTQKESRFGLLPPRAKCPIMRIAQTRSDRSSRYRQREDYVTGRPVFDLYRVDGQPL